MKRTALKLVIFLLILSMLPIALFACQVQESGSDTDTKATEADTDDTQSDSESETDTESESESKTETESDTESESESESKTETESESKAESDEVLKNATLFANGSYAMNLIIGDSATNDDKLLYNAIRDALYDKTGKRPTTVTDFGLADADKPAVLVGTTEYPQSKELNSSLEKGEAYALFVNGKYIIAYSNSESMVKLLNAIKIKINASSKDNIVIDDSWNISIEPEKLPEKVALPDYDGHKLNSPIDIGQGSELYIFSNTTYDKYSDFSTSLSQKGFKIYAWNEIGDNEFRTYITNSQIVNVMFLKNSKETRITVDNRDSIELQGTEAENIYSKTSTPSFTMMGIADAGYPGGMSFIFKLSDGTFFIIDGGICANREGSSECSGDPSVNRLFETLQELADDKDNIVISGWLVTHIHNDHAGAFIDLAEKPEYLRKITIKKVIYSQPADSDMQDGRQSLRLNWMPDALKKMNISKTVKAHPGQVFYFADLKLTILGTHDLVKPDTITSHNNASIVSMVEFGGKKMFFLADAEGAANTRLKNLYGNALDADILQVAHHGYNNTEADLVYPYITPSIVLWPIREADYKSGANVFNVWFNQTYLNKTGIKHYCAADANITFANMSTWLPTRENWKP